ncbi:hypothetical protein W03_10830 [Nitrosomonas sp. PY1]|uniref:polysaccharide pyruvyl transferase family protein n=1 Tax=Nitrosomonas sp. PY1 TaxID=1803906 RepID=UPI001FC87FCD|nr:polysaccharide pyruvyl transferase family protein [Nitrosomonas sp. PY1]GKS69079.1 hypothetical protein W03_10830 [Nitrosomonas sp. PY1]
MHTSHNRKLKIGILTFHRALNNGAVLQSFALQEAIKKLGHDAEIIDYRQNFIERRYQFFKINPAFITQPLIFLRNLIRSIKRLPYTIQRKKQFELFAQDHLQVSHSIVNGKDEIPQQYDIYIIGSDQVWNSNLTGGIDEIYWGAFSIPINSKKISYAASTPYQNLAYIAEEQLVRFIHNFDDISVREKIIQEKLQKYTSKPIKLVLDPTLILPKDVWEEIVTPKYKNERYIVIYQARLFKKNPKLLQEKARILANKLNCKVIDINNPLDRQCYSPSDFVSLIKYAQYVITSSFHGAAFSVIFNTPFYSICYDDGQDDRYAYLELTQKFSNQICTAK